MTGSLVFSVSGGNNSWPFVLLASTNLAPAHWVLVTTNEFDAGGNFNLTNNIGSGSPQTFYKLQLQ